MDFGRAPGFFGIGVGYAQGDANVNLGNISVIDDDDAGLAYQAILGVSHDFMPNLAGVGLSLPGAG